MNRTSISDLKAKARDQLLGNYGTATGTFALLFVLIYAAMMIISGALTAGMTDAADPAAFSGFSFRIKSQLLGVAIAALSATVTVGYMYILKRISEGARPTASDLFFVFRNHPDKVIIISLVMAVIQFILLMPATIAGSSVYQATVEDIDGRQFLIYVILYLAGLIISFIIDLMLAMSYLIYLEDPAAGALDIMKQSIAMMKGNKFRYFYMYLSFLGYWLLIVLSLGIAALWVMPYQCMTMIEFYTDLRDNGTYARVEEL